MALSIQSRHAGMADRERIPGLGRLQNDDFWRGRVPLAARVPRRLVYQAPTFSLHKSYTKQVQSPGVYHLGPYGDLIRLGYEVKIEIRHNHVL
jgi:hypothetical protein